MAVQTAIKRINEYKLEIPQTYQPGMRVKGVIYLDEMLEAGLEEKSIQQVVNVAMLPGIVKASMAMPDIHMGYGFAIGGVAAFRLEDGIISPGGVGYDINCGVRLLRSNLRREDVMPRLRELVAMLYQEIPSGVGSKGKLRFGAEDLKKVMVEGARWAVGQGLGDAADLERIESGGVLEGADPSLVSNKAFERGKSQIGSLGSGNHFLEIQHVDEVYDEAAANALGLHRGQVTVMIHTGSRGFGHQICTDFLDVMERAVRKYGITLPDRELACAPYGTREAEDYISAMRGAANFAWANRQCIMHWARDSFMKVLGMSPDGLGMGLVYDVAHNVAKIEEHDVDGRKTKLIVHRKGATRAFPPGHPELPAAYRKLGQPVLIPGDMGRASFVLLGTQKAMEETWGSTCHGAGRVLSRHQAIRQARGRSILRELEDKGILVMTAGRETLAEEMSEAYKDVSNVVDVVHRAGISKKVVRLRPMGVVKG